MSALGRKMAREKREHVKQSSNKSLVRFRIVRVSQAIPLSLQRHSRARAFAIRPPLVVATISKPRADQGKQTKAIARQECQAAQSNHKSTSIWFSLSSSSSATRALSSAPKRLSLFPFFEPLEEDLLTLRAGLRALASFFSGDASLRERALSVARVRLRPGVSAGLDEDIMEDFSAGVVICWSCGPRIVDMKSRAVNIVSGDGRSDGLVKRNLTFGRRRTFLLSHD